MSREDSRRRAERAHRLRSLGRTWQEIADAEGFQSRGAAQVAVRRFVSAEPAEGVDEVRRSASETLRIVRSVLVGRFAEAARSRDDETLVKLSREVHRNLGQWATLVGANAPERHEHDVQVTQTASAILDRAEADLLALAQTRPAPIIDAEVMDS